MPWNWVYAAVLAILFIGMAFMVGTGVIYFLEPKSDPEINLFEVLDTRTRTIVSQSNVPRKKFEVQVALPNGNLHWFDAFPNWVRGDSMICAKVSTGNWSGAFHVELTPNTC